MKRDSENIIDICEHGEVKTTCLKCREMGLAKPVPTEVDTRTKIQPIETKDGLPVLSASEFDRLYHTDIRALGSDTAATFDFQGYVKIETDEDARSYKPGKKGFFCRDVMATNGILKPENKEGLLPKSETHEGIHVGTDGLESHNDEAGINWEMPGPGLVKEYDIYVYVPRPLVSPKEDWWFNYADTDMHRMCIQSGLDAENDPLARNKIRLIHAAVVEYLERGGERDEISITNLVWALRKKLETIKLQQDLPKSIAALE